MDRAVGLTHPMNTFADLAFSHVNFTHKKRCSWEILQTGPVAD